MTAKRIIPCLDVKDGRVVKGVNFVNLTDAGNPACVAEAYQKAGADEIVFLDITASVRGAETVARTVSAVAERLSIPLSVGGGIRTESDATAILRAGADKVSVNTAAIRDPSLINRLADKFGRQCVVVAIDAKKQGERYRVYSQGGRREEELDALEWAKEAEMRGAGEILLTSIDRDGTNVGYECELTRAVSSTAKIPVIASGGAGNMSHFAQAFTFAQADAALAASVFHYHKIDIGELKKYLRDNGVCVRI